MLRIRILKPAVERGCGGFCLVEWELIFGIAYPIAISVQEGGFGSENYLVTICKTVPFGNRLAQ